MSTTDFGIDDESAAVNLEDARVRERDAGRLSEIQTLKKTVEVLEERLQKADQELRDAKEGASEVYRLRARSGNSGSICGDEENEAASVQRKSLVRDVVGLQGECRALEGLVARLSSEEKDLQASLLKLETEEKSVSVRVKELANEEKRLERQCARLSGEERVLRGDVKDLEEVRGTIIAEEGDRK